MKNLAIISVVAAMMLPLHAIAQEADDSAPAAPTASAKSDTVAPAPPAANPAAVPSIVVEAPPAPVQQPAAPAPLTKDQMKAEKKRIEAEEKYRKNADKEAKKFAKKEAAEQKWIGKKLPITSSKVEREIYELRKTVDSLKRVQAPAPTPAATEKRDANAMKDLVRMLQAANDSIKSLAAQNAEIAKTAQLALQTAEAAKSLQQANASGVRYEYTTGEGTPSPKKEKMKKGGDLCYKVQLQARQHKLENVRAAFELFDLRDSIYEDVVTGPNEIATYKYVIGPYSTIEKARQECFRVRNKGIKDAFVVPYYRGKRITMKEENELRGMH